jgi:5'(3')-deoxyribonucleotidase
MYESIRMVAIDLDDVLFDFLGHFFNWHNIKYGTSLKPVDMVYSSIWEAWEGTKEQAAKRVPAFFQEVDMINLPPIDGSIRALKIM